MATDTDDPWITGEGGVAYDPTLSVLEAIRDLSAGRSDLLRRSLVQQRCRRSC